jgi:hypothetical protein
VEKRTMKKYYYHFTCDTLRDGRPVPPIGKWLTHAGPIVPCDSGLHASEHPFDALQYAPGVRLHLVELGTRIQTHGNPVDKVVSNKRKIVKSIDATELLRKFARLCALNSLQFWKDSVPIVVKEYLETGDESKRVAAESAARSATRSAARSAAESAAQSAAWSAWSAARSAAESAARSARSAAETAERSAAETAAEAAHATAAESAAWSAAWSAWSAARSAAEEKQRALFKQLVMEAFNL